MSAYKPLYSSDVTVVPYTANKRWSFTYNVTPNDGYITYYIGTNSNFDINNSLTTNGEYESLIYSLANQLYYQTYTASLNTGSLAVSLYYESASSQRPTSSYFIYDDNPNFIKNFPSSSGDQIGLLSISNELFGDKILPYSFRLNSYIHNIIDDGKGNLYQTTDLSGSYVSASYVSASYFLEQSGSLTSHVGNIYYSQGIIIITNSDYVPDFYEPAYPITISFQNNYTIYENEVRCLVKESEFNLSYNPTLQTGSVTNVEISGSKFYLNDGTLRDFATGSDFSPYVTTLGLYNDNDELLAVAKFGKPLLISPNTDMTFVVKYDI